MTEYISPVLGKISENVYEYIFNKRILVDSKEQMVEFLNSIKRDLGFGVLKTGILWEETQGRRIDIRGSELESYFNTIGFPRATDIMKVFALNQTLIDDLVSEGVSIKEAIYGLDLAGRLERLNLERRTIETKYAREMLISVYPVAVIPEELPPPEICYRTQLAYLYVSKAKREGTPEVIAEFRVWGVSDEKGKYQIAKFDRVIMQMERIFKGEGKKPKKWLASLDKVIKASEEDEEIDCDEARMELNYALRGAAFRDEIGGKDAWERDERWIKLREKEMLDTEQLVTRFDNDEGELVNVTDVLKQEELKEE